MCSHIFPLAKVVHQGSQGGQPGQPGLRLPIDHPVATRRGALGALGALSKAADFMDVYQIL